jgi:hypothetical protein
MRKDNLLHHASRQPGLVGKYLVALAATLRNPGCGGRLQRAADTLDMVTGQRFETVPIARYTTDRLQRLSESDLDEWAYVLGAAMCGQQTDAIHRLRKQSPWMGWELIYAHYGCGFQDPPLCTDQTYVCLPHQADLIIGAEHRIYEADHYLIVLKPRRLVFWLECGLCGVRGPRPNLIPAAPQP